MTPPPITTARRALAWCAHGRMPRAKGSVGIDDQGGFGIDVGGAADLGPDAAARISAPSPRTRCR